MQQKGTENLIESNVGIFNPEEVLGVAELSLEEIYSRLTEVPMGSLIALSEKIQGNLEVARKDLEQAKKVRAEAFEEFSILSDRIKEAISDQTTALMVRETLGDDIYQRLRDLTSLIEERRASEESAYKRFCNIERLSTCVYTQMTR